MTVSHVANGVCNWPVLRRAHHVVRRSPARDEWGVGANGGIVVSTAGPWRSSGGSWQRYHVECSSRPVQTTTCVARSHPWRFFERRPLAVVHAWFRGNCTECEECGTWSCRGAVKHDSRASAGHFRVWSWHIFSLSGLHKILPGQTFFRMWLLCFGWGD